MSKNKQRLCFWLGLGLFWIVVAVMSMVILPARGGAPPGAAGQGMGLDKNSYVILSGEFFQAMDKLARSGVVTGDPQHQLLEQIATAQRFMVKTNLTLIQQNEKIIRLLEDLNRQRQGGGR